MVIAAVSVWENPLYPAVLQITCPPESKLDCELGIRRPAAKKSRLMKNLQPESRGILLTLHCT
jgi:hypothetical protein